MDFSKYNRLIRCSLIILSFFTTCLGNSQSSIIEGLIAYYPLDGDAVDLSGNCNHGTVYGASATNGIDKSFMTAMAFDGLDDYIEIPHSSHFDFQDDQDFAISFWLQISDLQVDLDTLDNDIISKWVSNDASMEHQVMGYPFSFRVINQKQKSHNQIYAAQFGGYRFGCKGSTTLQTKYSSQSNRFAHVLLNVKNGKHYLYVNGQLVKRKGSDVFCTIRNESPIRLGKRGGLEFQNHFAGALDNLAFYNRALSEDDIAILSNETNDLASLLRASATNSDKISSDTLFFDDDAFQLTMNQREQLAYFIKYLDVGTQYHVVITGHTNGLPPTDFCDILSLKRAKVVEQYLFDLGIACGKITTKGLGKRHQVASNATPELRKKNQRVEIVLYKVTKV